MGLVSEQSGAAPLVGGGDTTLHSHPGGGGGPVVKSGQATGGSVTFGTAFAGVPNVVLTGLENDEGSQVLVVWVLTKSATGFTYHIRQHTSFSTYTDVTATMLVEWVATNAGNS